MNCPRCNVAMQKIGDPMPMGAHDWIWQCNKCQLRFDECIPKPMECKQADPNCEGDLRQTPVGILCGWHSATMKWCDHCLNASLDRMVVIECIDGLDIQNLPIKLCVPCYTQLLDKLKAGS